MGYNPPDFSVHGVLQASTRVGSHPLLQWLFPFQDSNWCFRRLQVDSLSLRHLENLLNFKDVRIPASLWFSVYRKPLDTADVGPQADYFTISLAPTYLCQKCYKSTKSALIIFICLLLELVLHITLARFSKKFLFFLKWDMKKFKSFLTLGSIAQIGSLNSLLEVPLPYKEPLVVQLLSHSWLFATPWTAASQAFLPFTISWWLPKLLSIQSMMPLASYFSKLTFYFHCLHSLVSLAYFLLSLPGKDKLILL